MKKGFKHTEKTKRKIGHSLKGKNTWMKGKTAWNKGLPAPWAVGNKHAKGLISPMKDKKHTKESIKKMSLSHIGQIPWNKNKKNVYSKETLTKMKIGATGKFGEDSSNWRGGRTSLHKLIRESQKYKTWRNKIFERDNYTCRKCRKHGVRLNADHIKEFSIISFENNIKSLREALQCKELWDISNGQTFCEDCHKNKTINFLKKNWKNQYSPIIINKQELLCH